MIPTYLSLLCTLHCREQCISFSSLYLHYVCRVAQLNNTLLRLDRVINLDWWFLFVGFFWRGWRGGGLVNQKGGLMYEGTM